MTNIRWSGWLVTTGLFSVFLLLGLWAARRARKAATADLILAGRDLPLWLATLTMTATWVDGGYLLGAAEGTQRSLASGLQGGVGFGLSLVVGGLFFARPMRRLGFTTLIDPFAARFGPAWAAALAAPALVGEILWTAELLVAIGSTFSVLLGAELTTAILLSAAVVTLYTAVGGMWSVAYTDAFQLSLVPIGMAFALPYALEQVGGWSSAFHQFQQTTGDAGAWWAPFSLGGPWSLASLSGWWDVSLMLLLGGIPWNCYFQRVLSCRSAAAAQWHSIFAGFLTIALTIPPVLLGVVAAVASWPEEVSESLAKEPSLALPMVLDQLVPPLVGLLGLGAIIGAVTSSFSASLLSASAMLTWNIIRGLAPRIGDKSLAGLVRFNVVAVAAVAIALALKARSVQQLWFLTSDLVYVLLFPQLTMALFARSVNRTGSIVAFVASLTIRAAAGEPSLGIAPLIDWARFSELLFGADASGWTDPDTGATHLPVRTAAALAGLVLMPLVSRLTRRWDPPTPLVG